MVSRILTEKSALRVLIPAVILALVVSGCASFREWRTARAAAACQVTEPEWLTPPDDSAVLSEPVAAYYYANQDRSILAGAWWWDNEDYPLSTDEQGFKVGWFRPEGADINIEGRRIDGEAPPLIADVPCCYPTRFQSSGLYFPTDGCWEITAAAADAALTFTVWVEPAP